jgi:hypothetical protein
MEPVRRPHPARAGRPSGTAERVHEPLPGGGFIYVGLFGKPHDECVGSGRFGIPGRHRVDADVLWAEFIRKPLAVGGQRGLCGSLYQGRLVKRHPALDRRNVHADSAFLFDHRRKKAAAEPHRRKQVDIDWVLPIDVGESQRPTAGCGGAADIIDDDVEASVAREHSGDDFVRAGDSADVSGNKFDAGRDSRRRGARRRNDGGAAADESIQNGFANAFGSACHGRVCRKIPWSR